MCANFSPDDLRAGAVKWLTCLLPACTLSMFGMGSLPFLINNLSEDTAQLFFFLFFFSCLFSHFSIKINGFFLYISRNSTVKT